MTGYRLCEVVGWWTTVGAIALILYAVNDTMFKLAHACHPEHIDLGLAMAFVGMLLIALGKRK